MTSSLKNNIRGGGTSSYYPKMLLKVLVYTYLCNLYSLRKIEQVLYENIHFMWLSLGAKTDKSSIIVVFLLAEEGVLSLKELFVDGTKIEANANKYTFVWSKSIKTRKEKTKQQLKDLWIYVEKMYKQEQKTSNEPDFEEISSDKIRKYH